MWKNIFQTIGIKPSAFRPISTEWDGSNELTVINEYVLIIPEKI